jgi:hypothetical protein
MLRISPNAERVYRAALIAAGPWDGPVDPLPTLDELHRAVEAQCPTKGAPQQQRSSIENYRAPIEPLARTDVGPQAIYDRLRQEHTEFSGSVSAVKRTRPAERDADVLERELKRWMFVAAGRLRLRWPLVKPVRLPSRSPNLNAYAARWIGSVRRECLARVIPLGERHLRQIVLEYVAHYHGERNHQGLSNRLITPTNDNAANSGRVVRRQRLGGALNYYCRKAA